MNADTIIPRRLSEEDAAEVKRVFFDRCLGQPRALEDQFERDCWAALVYLPDTGWEYVRVWRDERVACSCSEWRNGAICPHVAYAVVTIHPWLVGGCDALRRAQP